MPLSEKKRSDENSINHETAYVDQAVHAIAFKRFG